MDAQDSTKYDCKTGGVLEDKNPGRCGPLYYGLPNSDVGDKIIYFVIF